MDELCMMSLIMHNSILMSAISGKDANFEPEFCPERAREGVIPVTAGTLAKGQNNAGLEE
jgi:hypothetical protein